METSNHLLPKGFFNPLTYLKKEITILMYFSTLSFRVLTKITQNSNVKTQSYNLKLKTF